jgi:hypothetical protein
LPNHTKVIALPVLQWRFFDYADDIDIWYQGLSEGARDILESLLKVNSKARDSIQWTGCKMLQGACKQHGIWEWRFRDGAVQQRLLGIFGSERKTAIFLIACNHKDNVYKPVNCLDTAIKRAKTVKSGAKFRERQIRSNL